GVRIVGWGTYVPETVLTNEDIRQRLIKKRLEAEDWLKRHSRPPMTEEQAKEFETSDKWIMKNVGFRERRIAAPGQSTTDLGKLALEAALKQTRLTADDLDGVIATNVTMDHPYSPSNSPLIQFGVGIPAFLNTKVQLTGKPMPRDGKYGDNALACCSFLCALDTADSHIRSGKCRRLAVIGADAMFETVNWNSRNFACVLGDGGFAVIIEAVPEGQPESFGVNHFFSGCDGSQADLVCTPAGGTRKPLTPETLDNPFDQGHKLDMNGPKLFETVIPLIAEQVIPAALEKAGRSLNEIAVIVLHQANLRMNRLIEAKLSRLGFTGVVFNNGDKYGNTTSASIGLAHAEAVAQGVVKPGQLVLWVAFGGGLSWYTALVRWL
ncbi:MAG: ketoacyl-ACP synthase III, partial [Candidatus Edwardsbacteria bacterium]|nr:ketoacyl-ACP synthase III [Candidatus Edwardsbacteria bacterium]